MPDLFHLSHHDAVSSTLPDKPQTTCTREDQIRRKCGSLNLSQQNPLGINDINKVAGSSIDVAGFGYFDTIWNPLICFVYHTTVLDTAIGEDVVSVNLESATFSDEVQYGAPGC